MSGQYAFYFKAASKLRVFRIRTFFKTSALFSVGAILARQTIKQARTRIRMVRESAANIEGVFDWNQKMLEKEFSHLTGLNS